MPKYTVKSPINDGERHEIGAIVELDDKTATPLLERGDIEPFVETRSSGAGNTDNTGPTDAAERLDAIKGAIASLDKNDTSLWTKGGFPTLDALEAKLDWRPAASEREQALAEMQPPAPTE